MVSYLLVWAVNPRVRREVVANTDLGKQNTQSCLFFRRAGEGRPVWRRQGDIFIVAPSGQHNLLLLDVPQQIGKHSTTTTCKI